jgi:hypothetical protein
VAHATGDASRTPTLPEGRRSTTMLAMRHLLVLLALAAAGDGWTVAARVGDVEVQERERPGSRVKDVQTVAVVAPPAVVRRVVTDWARWAEVMPYTQEGRV